METIRVQLESGVEVIACRSGVASADEPVVVLLHGIGMSHRSFEELQPLLALELCVISFDLPGFGATSRPGRPFTVADHAEAVDQALQHLGVGRRVVVGHSMGAQFAIEQAIRRPSDVAGIVLVGPVVDTRRRNLPAQARDLSLDMLREPVRANARVLIDYVRGGLGWYLVTLKAMFDYDTEARTRRAGCPVIVVRGEHDPVAREPWCRRLASAAPAGGALVTVPGHAHVVPLTNPEAVGGVVLRLVREVA